MKQTLRGKVIDLLRSKNCALDFVDIAKGLDVEEGKIIDALYGLKKRGIVRPVGKKPWHYLINYPDGRVRMDIEYEPEPGGMGVLSHSGMKPLNLNKLKGISKKVVSLIVSNESPLNAREIAERLKIDLSSVRYSLSISKRKGIVKAIGKQPWHYVINEDPVVPLPTTRAPVKKKKATIEGTITTNYSLVIIYTLKGSEEPHLMAFKASQSQAFISAFEKLQENENLATIGGFKKLKCVTKVIMTPKVAEKKVFAPLVMKMNVI